MIPVEDPAAARARCRAQLAKMVGPGGAPLSEEEINRQTVYMMGSWYRYFGAAYDQQQRERAARERGAAEERDRQPPVLASGKGNLTIGPAAEPVDKAPQAVSPKLALVTPPGYRLERLLRVIFSGRTFERVFAQALADERDEIFQAMSEHRVGKVRWRRVVLYLVLLDTLMSQAFVSVAKRIQEIWGSTRL
jgi:hypothetical protein